MASASQLPSSSASSNRNLYDVLRSLSSRSLKRARTEDSEDREEVVQHEDNASPPLPLSSDTATTQNDHARSKRGSTVQQWHQQANFHLLQLPRIGICTMF
mmetsp:Transcript_37152/g.90311  ORF Transcript_37152/g.90311 Transcript_37152/m.90311 type:complete len:101 (-) Transcript_37152:139-441(-)